jgi:hypothetical protein
VLTKDDYDAAAFTRNSHWQRGHPKYEHKVYTRCTHGCLCTIVLVGTRACGRLMICNYKLIVPWMSTLVP